MGIVTGGLILWSAPCQERVLVLRCLGKVKMKCMGNIQGGLG